MTYQEARAEAELRFLNGARAYALSREDGTITPSWLWFAFLMLSEREPQVGHEHYRTD